MGSNMTFCCNVLLKRRIGKAGEAVALAKGNRIKGLWTESKVQVVQMEPRKPQCLHVASGLWCEGVDVKAQRGGGLKNERPEGLESTGCSRPREHLQRRPGPGSAAGRAAAPELPRSCGVWR